MNINVSKYNPSFQKQLRAKANIINNNKPEQCNIYELNKEEDFDYFEKLIKNPSWEKAKYLESLDKLISKGYLDNHIFVMESKEGECLGFLNVEDRNLPSDYQNLNYIETSPNYSKSNEKRDRKYIGQTLLAFVVKSLMQNDKSYVRISTPIRSSVGFYIDKCGFKPYTKGSTQLYLYNNEFADFVDLNEKNTHGKIELVE